MPELVEELFENAGVNIDKYFKYEKLDIACKYFWCDGLTFNAYSNNQKFLNEVKKNFNNLLPWRGGGLKMPAVFMYYHPGRDLTLPLYL